MSETSTAEREAASAAEAPPRTLPWARTPRLALREFGPGDQAALMRMHRDPRLGTYLLDDYPLDDPAVARVFLERLTLLYRRYEGFGIWHASIPAEDGWAFAGFFNLMPMAERPGEVELGSRLQPAAWGRGVAMEGCELLLDHAFDRLGLPRVWAICHPFNRSARAVINALGFVDMGLQSYDGHLARHHLVTAASWRQARALPRRERLRLALRRPVPTKLETSA